MNKRISLTETDFYSLTKGDTLLKEDVEIALQDIGYVRMMEIIVDHVSKDSKDISYKNFKNSNHG